MFEFRLPDLGEGVAEGEERGGPFVQVNVDGDSGMA